MPCRFIDVDGKKHTLKWLCNYDIKMDTNVLYHEFCIRFLPKIMFFFQFSVQLLWHQLEMQNLIKKLKKKK